MKKCAIHWTQYLIIFGFGETTAKWAWKPIKLWLRGGDFGFNDIKIKKIIWFENYHSLSAATWSCKWLIKWQPAIWWAIKKTTGMGWKKLELARKPMPLIFGSGVASGSNVTSKKLNKSLQKGLGEETGRMKAWKQLTHVTPRQSTILARKPKFGVVAFPSPGGGRVVRELCDTQNNCPDGPCKGPHAKNSPWTQILMFAHWIRWTKWSENLLMARDSDPFEPHSLGLHRFLSRIPPGLRGNVKESCLTKIVIPRTCTCPTAVVMCVSL